MVMTLTLEELLAEVVDPEIPVLSIADLGVLRSVSVDEGGVIVTITPTYSGCPALCVIEVQKAMTTNDKRSNTAAWAWATFTVRWVVGLIFFMAGWWKCFPASPA